MQGAQVPSLVKELDPICPQLRVHMLQLEIPPATVKTQHSQINEYKHQWILFPSPQLLEKNSSPVTSDSN